MTEDTDTEGSETTVMVLDAREVIVTKSSSHEDRFVVELTQDEDCCTFVFRDQDEAFVFFYRLAPQRDYWSAGDIVQLKSGEP